MGRNRVIDPDTVLDAAERVVRRDGALHLTLEAVAAEAGICKASVLYDYKTKKALIKAIIERRIAIENERVREFTERLGDVPDAPIRGKIIAAFRSVSDEERAVGINLAAALAQDEEFREPIRQAYGELVCKIMSTSEQPRGALLALLAVEGLKLMDWCGFYSCPENDRARLKAELLWLLEQSPQPAERQPEVAPA